MLGLASTHAVHTHNEWVCVNKVHTTNTKTHTACERILYRMKKVQELPGRLRSVRDRNGAATLTAGDGAATAAGGHARAVASTSTCATYSNTNAREVALRCELGCDPITEHAADGIILIRHEQ